MPDIGVVFKSMPPMVWVLLALVVALKVFFLWWDSQKQKGVCGQDGLVQAQCHQWHKLPICG